MLSERYSRGRERVVSDHRQGTSVLWLNETTLWPRNSQVPITVVSPDWLTLGEYARRGPYDVAFDATVRSYYFNDQRIEWTGQEATFGVEANLRGAIRRETGGWDTTLWGEVYLRACIITRRIASEPRACCLPPEVL